MGDSLTFGWGVPEGMTYSDQVARRLGPDWDLEILEMHHHGKVDAPSGTALALGRTAAAARGAAFDEDIAGGHQDLRVVAHRVRARRPIAGHVGSPYPPTIPST